MRSLVSTSQSTISAIEWGVDNSLSLVELPELTVEQPNDVLIEVEAAQFGAALRRAVTVGHPTIVPPRVLGTLVAGVVKAAGSSALVRQGDRVTINPHPACGTCTFCQSRLEALCGNLAHPSPGGLAEIVRVRSSPDSFELIPESLEFEVAVHAELLACVLEALSAGSVDSSSDVAIIGSGPLALLAVQACRTVGAANVTCVTRRSERAALAATFGAVTYLQSELLQLGHDEIPKFDVVIEMSGDPEALLLAFRLSAPGASIVAFSGYPPGTTVAIPINSLHYEGLRLLGSYHFSRGRFSKAMELLISGAIHLEGIITHRLRLEEAADAPTISADPDCVSLVITSNR